MATPEQFKKTTIIKILYNNILSILTKTGLYINKLDTQTQYRPCLNVEL
jgi:hypothetical protein